MEHDLHPDLTSDLGVLPKLASVTAAELAQRLIGAGAIFAQMAANTPSHRALDMILKLFVRTEAGAATHVNELMAASGATTTSAFRQVASLEAAGLLRRTPDAVDRRRVLVDLTDDGRALVLAMVQATYEPPCRWKRAAD